MYHNTTTADVAAGSSPGSLDASVIIPAHNAERTIANLVRGCLQQDFAPRRYEIIIVDDGSTDDTWAEARQFADSPNVIVVRQPNLGAAAARNHGARVASGDVLVFCDSDMVVPPHWLRRLVKAASDPDAGLVGCVYAPAEDLPLAASCMHEEIRRRQIMGPDTPLHIGSFTMALRRSLFERVGGFDSDFMRAQDTELSYRVAATGCQSRLLKDLTVHHDHPRTLREWLANQYKQAFWRARTYARYPCRTAGDGYSCWRDWASLAAAAAAIVTAPLALRGNLWMVPAGMLLGLAALQIPPTLFAVRDTGECRHIALVPMQMMRSVAWLAGGAASILVRARRKSEIAETTSEVSSVRQAN
jgi:GT2 family glycosyltransferase